MAERRIALIIAGGVSLGSYEAGVIDELMYSLESLNNREEPNTDAHKYTIDVITGGSAGSMNGAMIARAMMYDYTGRKENLFKAWVERIDVKGLLKPPIPGNAIFSSGVIDAISNDLLLDGVNNGTSPPVIAPANFAPPSLRLFFSLSNMNGIDYTQDYTPKDPPGFVSTMFSDMASFTVDRTTTWQQWRALAASAVASGNFPFAFRPRVLERPGSMYPGSTFEKNPDYKRWRPAFMDGGIFNNEPLREAIHAAAEIDSNLDDKDPDSRIFILIDPFINESRAVVDVAPDGNLLSHLGRLLTMVRGESTAKDYLRSQRRNKEMEWRDKLVNTLGGLISKMEPSSPSIAEANRELEATGFRILGEKAALFPERYAGVTLDQLVERNWALAPHHVRTRHPVSANGPRERLLKNALFLLNNAAGLQNKSAIRLNLIGARPSELAGDPLEGFAGFFVRDWREYDYVKGRINARRLLPEILGCQELKRDPAGKYDIPSAWADFPRVTMRNVPKDELRKVRNLIANRIVDLATSFVGDRVKSHGLFVKAIYRCTWPVASWCARLILRWVVKGVMLDPQTESTKPAPEGV